MIRLNFFAECKYNPWLFAVLLQICFLVSAGFRYQQFEIWEKTPTVYFVDERPMMTTLDAPYWLRWAREYNDGTYGVDYLRSYPEGSEKFLSMSVPPKFKDSTTFHYKSANDEIKYRNVPLLSFLVANLSPFFNYNYYLTGTLMIPVLASIFIFPLGIYFFKIGMPLAGLLGGLIGTFAEGYYLRSSIGRIDTDMLNLFFPVLTSLLILMASLAKSERSVLLYSAGAGLSQFLFMWWYTKTGFVLAFFSVLVFMLFIKQIRFQTILLSAFLFILCSFPQHLMHSTTATKGFLSSYFEISDSANNQVYRGVKPASFPNVLKTISEVNKVSVEKVFKTIISKPIFNWTGLLAFVLLVLFRWRFLIPLAPMLALGLLSFQSSNRFIMYLGPFIGIGLGLLINIGIEGLFSFLPWNNSDNTAKKKSAVKDSEFAFSGVTEKKGITKSQSNIVTNRDVAQKYNLSNLQRINWFSWVRQGTLYLVMFVFFWGISSQTAISFVPGPSIHTGIYKTFLEVKKRVPEDSALLTWWDYGYAITDATGLATFHDGGSQLRPTTYFTARGLISPNPDEFYDITQFLATESNRGITEYNTSTEALLKAVRNPKHKPWNPIYLFFTADMTGKFGAISNLGSWDMLNGGSQPKVYQNLACNKITNKEITCRGVKIDLKTGLINNQLSLSRIIFVRDGYVLREQKFGHKNGLTLQLLVKGKNIVEVQLIDELVFRSNYNQMFLLGRYQKDLFEETYNAFPFSRLYRIKY